MDERSGRWRGAASPQRSPDGRWWWNGREWEPASAPVEPRRRFYLVALSAAAAALLLVVAASIFSGLPGAATRVTAPGTAEITLAEPGTYTISYEHQTAGEPGGAGVPSEVRSMQLELAPIDSETRVPIHPLSGDFISVEGSTEDVAVEEFSIDHSGTYTLVSRYPDGQTGKPVVLAIAPGAASNSDHVLAAYLVATALLLGGLALASVTLILRLRAAWLRRRASAPVVPDASGHVALDPAAIRRALDHVEAMSRRLSEEGHAKVVEIIADILELIPHASRFPPGSRDLFVLQRTATEYLPTSVAAYLALPASYATTVVLRDGKTALGILGDQLELLGEEVNEIGDAMRHRDSDRLLVHGRFLELAFRHGSNELELPRAEDP